MTPQKPVYRISMCFRGCLGAGEVGNSTIQLRDEVCEVQRTEEREVAGFGAEETGLLVLRCGRSVYTLNDDVLRTYSDPWPEASHPLAQRERRFFSTWLRASSYYLAAMVEFSMR